MIDLQGVTKVLGTEEMLLCLSTLGKQSLRMVAPVLSFKGPILINLDRYTAPGKVNPGSK